MIEFDIEEIKESIQDLSDNDKLKVLEEKETEIQSLIDELEGYLSEIEELGEEIKIGNELFFAMMSRTH